MTETYKAYLQRLPYALGILVATCIFRYILLNSFHVDPDSFYWPAFMAFFVSGAGILLALGIVVQAIPHAVAAIAAHAGVTVFHFLVAKSIGKSALPAPAEVIISLYNNIELLPWIFFVSRLARHWKQQRTWIIIAVFVAYRGLIAANAGYPFTGISPMFAGSYSSWYEDAINMSLQTATWCAFVLLLTELVIHANNNVKPVFYKFRITADTSPAGSTIAFWALKSLLLFSPWLLTHLLSQSPVLAGSEEHDWALYYLKFDWLLSVISCVAVLAAGMVYLRLHILEFLFRFGIHLRVMFWLLTIPFIGLITWLLTGVIRQPVQTTRRLTTLKQFRKDPTTATIVSVLFAYLLLVLWMFNQYGSEDFLYFLVGSAILFLIFTLRFQTYQVQLGIYLAIITYAIFDRLLAGGGYPNGIGGMFGGEGFSYATYFKLLFAAQLSMIGAAWSVLLLPAFHDTYFQSDAEEETGSPEEGHLFAEHELQ